MADIEALKSDALRLAGKATTFAAHLRAGEASDARPDPADYVELAAMIRRLVEVMPGDQAGELARELAEALKDAYAEMEAMGDALNGMDAVTAEGEERATPRFQMVRSAITKARAANLLPTETTAKEGA